MTGGVLSGGLGPLGTTYDGRVFGSRIAYALKRTAEELELPPRPISPVEKLGLACCYPILFTYYLLESRLLKRTSAPDGRPGYSMTIDKVVSDTKKP